MKIARKDHVTVMKNLPEPIMEITEKDVDRHYAKELHLLVMESLQRKYDNRTDELFMEMRHLMLSYYTDLHNPEQAMSIIMERAAMENTLRSIEF